MYRRDVVVWTVVPIVIVAVCIIVIVAVVRYVKKRRASNGNDVRSPPQDNVVVFTGKLSKAITYPFRSYLLERL